MRAVVPVERVAGHRSRVTIQCVVHRQVQGHDAVAVLGAGQRPAEIAALGVRAVVPVERVAGNGRSVAVQRVVHRQVQGIGTRTAQVILIFVKICTTHCVCMYRTVASYPCIAVTFCHSLNIVSTF